MCACTGWSDREKEGLPRLVEALESHLWSSMRRRGTEVEEEGREAVREKGGVGETKGSIGPHPHREEVEAVTGGPKAAANAADEDPELKEVGVHADRSASFGPYNSSGSGASMPGVGSRSDGGGGGKINSELPTAYALRKLVIFEGSGSQENGEDDVGCELVLLGYCRVRVLLGRVDLAGYTVRGPAGSLEEAVRAFQVGEAQEKASYLDVFSPSTTALLSVRPQKPSPTSSSPSPPVAAVLELSELPRDRGEVGNASYLLSHRSARFFATDTLFDFSEAAGPVSCHAFGLPCQGLWSCFPGLSVRVQALHRSKYRLSCHAKAEDVLRAGAPAASLYRSSNTHPAVAGVLGGSYSPLRSLALGAAWYEAAEAALLGDRAVERGPGTIASVADTSGTANSAAEVLKVIIGRRVVVCGGVKQGKSSFARFLVNRAFQCVSHPGAAAAASPSGGREGIAVAYVDLDPGQTEFSAPGLFSLSIVTSPLLGPPFSHAQSSSCCCCGRGIANASTENISNNAMSIVDGPVACTHLFYFGSLAVDGSGVHRIAAITNTIISLYLSRYAHMPLIVNTMGWVDGLGLESLLRVLAVVRPDAVCAFPSANAPLSGSVPLHRFPAGAVPRRLEPELGRRYAYLDDAVCEWIATQSQKTSMLLVSRPEPEVAETGGDTPVQFASARAYKRSKMPGGGSITGCGASPAQLRILMWQACFLSHASLGDPSRPPRTVWDARPLALRAALAIPLASQQLRVVSVDPTAGGIMRDEQASLLRAVLRPNEVLAVFTHTRSDLYPQGREDPSVGRECCGVCVVVSVDDLYLRVIAPWRSSAERAILETIAAAAAATEGGGAGLGATGPTGSAAASSLLLLRVLSPRSGGGALVMPPEVSGVQAS
jgi:polynucleotide 5'-hydroxyl-kinase GRC3/NOL9